MDDGYEEAEVIEKEIGSLLMKYPVTKENALAWKNFTRTISTGLDILNVWIDKTLTTERI